MFECLQTEIHLGHELTALEKVLLGPGVHLVQGQPWDEPQQPANTLVQGDPIDKASATWMFLACFLDFLGPQKGLLNDNKTGPT